MQDRVLSSKASRKSSSTSPVEFPVREYSTDTVAPAPGSDVFLEAALVKSNLPLSTTRQNVFFVFITLTQMVQMIPRGVGLNSGLAIGEALDATNLESVWIVASYQLTQGAFVLIGGRLGAVYGHKHVLSLGCMWWVVWALCGGFSTNLTSLCLFRALCGVGGGLMTPNLVALMGITFSPGRKRNIGMALIGAMAPVGAAGGSLVSAAIVQLSEWKWVFLMLGLLGFVVFSVALVAIPEDQPVDPSGEIDWIGAYLGVTTLLLFNVVWNQAPIVGWYNIYEPILLVLSLLHLVGFVYWESKIAKEPILPFNIWKAPSFGYLMIVVFFSFMSLGIFFWYLILYMINIRGDSLITVGLQFLPLTVVGCANTFFAAWLVPRVSAQFIIGISCLAMTVISILLAVIPANLSYWAMAFPAMLLSAFTLDLIVTSAQIIASNTVPKKHQGVAGSLVGTLLSYGMSTGLGFAGLIEVYTYENGTNLLRGYHSAAYLAIALAVTSLIIGVVFIRIPKDTREGWDPEEELEEKKNISSITEAKV